jgi:hypothetical protein
MNRRAPLSRAYAALALLFALAPAPLRAEHSVAVPTDPAARAKVALTLPADVWDGAGFMPIAVAIQNDAAEERVWQFDFEVRAGIGGGRSAGVSSFRLAVPAGGNQETVLYLPGPGRADNVNYTVGVMADVRGPGVGSGRITVLGNGQMKRAYLAAPTGLANRLRALGPSPSGSRGFSPADRAGFEVKDMDPARWPADWRVWAPFNLVALGADEFLALDSARQAALRDWVALGGRLLLEPSSPQAEERVEKIGLGNITTWHGSLQQVYDAGGTTTETIYQITQLDRAGRSTPVVVNVPPGRTPPPGAVPVTRTVGPNLATLPQLQAAAPRDKPWTGRFSLLTADDFTAAVVTKNPLLLILFLAVFAVLVGPVNLFVFAPPGRRHRLFFTVPALSLLASLGLGAVIVVGDGFGGAGSRRALVVLLPGSNRAAIFQEQVARTGVLFGRSFPLAADTAAVQTLADSGEAGLNDSAPDARLRRDGEEASGDWFRSRLRQAQALWRITPTRARVELVAGGTGGAPPVVQSSLGTALRDFVYLDNEGNAWTVESLPPGQRVTLKTDAHAWAAHDVAKASNGRLAPVTSKDPPVPGSPEYLRQARLRQPGTQEYSWAQQLEIVRRDVENYQRAGQPPPPHLLQQIDQFETQLGLKNISATPVPPLDPRERGHFYALGGPGDLAPLATSAAIRWNEESVIYTGRLEAARAP